MKCKECGAGLRRSGGSSEPEGIRQDAECPGCGRRYAVTKAGLVKLTEEDGTPSRNGAARFRQRRIADLAHRAGLALSELRGLLKLAEAPEYQQQRLEDAETECAQLAEAAET